MHTFLEDTKYLEPCAKVMKLILPDKLDCTIRRSFQTLYNGQRRIQIQTDENNYEHRLEASAERAEWKAYRQLWLYAMRHFNELTSRAPRQDHQGKKLSNLREELIWWSNLFKLAKSSGYTDVHSHFPTISEADEEMSVGFLQRVRPATMYDLSSVEFHNTVQDFMQLLQQIMPRRTSTQEVKLTEFPQHIAYRCGVPYEQKFFEDRSLLFYLACITQLDSET